MTSIETIVRQMLRRVKITDVGDTNFLLEEQVEKWLFEEENNRVLNEVVVRQFRIRCYGHTSIFVDRILYFGILFPETTKVLTEASFLERSITYGLKENVIMGRLILLPVYRVIGTSVLKRIQICPKNLKLQKMRSLRASSR